MDEDGVQIEVEDSPVNEGGFFENRELKPGGENAAPESLADGLTAATEFLAAYGWYILFAIIGLWYLKSRFNSQIQSFQAKRAERNESNRYDSAELMARQEAIQRARERMQHEHNAKAGEYAVKQQEKEEERRKAQIEDWERHKEGRGYRSKVKVTEDYYPSTDSNKKDNKPKKRIREDYNPLMGSGGGVGFRPPRRNVSSGG